MMAVEEALQRLLALLRPVGAETVALPAALGRVLAEDVAARRTQPPFDVSSMDGYAARTDAVPQIGTRLRVVGAVPAGQAHGGSLAADEAVRIFTGAPVPPGADCVILQEDVTRDGDGVLVGEVPRRGQFIRPAGLDFREGDALLKAGRRLTVRDVALAAAMNRPWLPVRRRPVVAILACGDEIAMPGDPLGPHQIVSSNGLGLAAFVAACGGEARHLPLAADDPVALVAGASGAAGADLLVTTGGASVGDHDLVRSALGPAGLDVDLWQIAMRPGKPLMVGRFAGLPMLGLPGNPVSTQICAMVFLAPALARLAGADDVPLPRRVARLGAALPANDRREDYLRARLTPGGDGVPVAEAFARQDSSMTATLAAADALIVRPPHAPAASAGDAVSIIALTGPNLF